MSANLYWQPLNDKNGGYGTPVRDIVMRRADMAGGKLSNFDLEFLRGVRASVSAFAQADLDEMIDAIERWGAIRVWVES